MLCCANKSEERKVRHTDSVKERNSSYLRCSMGHCEQGWNCCILKDQSCIPHTAAHVMSHKSHEAHQKYLQSVQSSNVADKALCVLVAST